MHNYQKQIKQAQNALNRETLKFLSSIRGLGNNYRTLVAVADVYVPEELILAFGALPIHMCELADIDVDKFSLCIYSATKKTRKLALDKTQSFMMPHRQGCSFEEYQSSVLSLQCFLEQYFGAKLDEIKLQQAIRDMNSTRHILSMLAEIRRLNNDLIARDTWQDYLKASWLLERSKFNKICNKPLQAITHIPVKDCSKANFIVSCSSNELIAKQSIEASGACISCDIEEQNFSRFQKNVTEQEPLIAAIAEAYYHQHPSANFVHLKKRVEKMKELVKLFHATAIVYEVSPGDTAKDREIDLLRQSGTNAFKFHLA